MYYFTHYNFPHHTLEGCADRILILQPALLYWWSDVNGLPTSINAGGDLQ